VHYTLAYALQLREKHGKTSVRVAACTSQADTVQYKKNEQLNTQKKNSNTDAEDVVQGAPLEGFSG
jgi:peroxiredoxin family protein